MPLEYAERSIICRLSRCLVPAFDGAYFSQGWKKALWGKFFLQHFSPELLRKQSTIPLVMSPFVKKNVVIMGGKLHRCQTAEYLVHLRRKITIVDEGTEKEIGNGLIEIFLKTQLLYRLKDHGVTLVNQLDCACGWGNLR
jgi:hypothetical protein